MKESRLRDDPLDLGGGGRKLCEKKNHPRHEDEKNTPVGGEKNYPCLKGNCFIFQKKNHPRKGGEKKNPPR